MPVKANCFHSIGRVLGAHTRLTKQVDQVPEENAGVWSMCERLFNSLGAECTQESTMIFLMNTLKQPFEELRTSVFHVLRSVAAQNSPWGIRVLLSYGGFFEFLLDRTTEPTKETREWKFAVLDAVLASPFQSQLGKVLATSRLSKDGLTQCYAFVGLLLSCCRSIVARKVANEYASWSLCWSDSPGGNGARVGVKAQSIDPSIPGWFTLCWITHYSL